MYLTLVVKIYLQLPNRPTLVTGVILVVVEQTFKNLGYYYHPVVQTARSTKRSLHTATFCRASIAVESHHMKIFNYRKCSDAVVRITNARNVIQIVAVLNRSKTLKIFYFRKANPHRSTILDLLY